MEKDEKGNEVFKKFSEPLSDILKRRSLSKKEWIELKKYCDNKEIHFFTTASYFDEVDFMVDELKMDSIKIASSDVKQIDFIKYCARKGVNIQLDTGSSDIWEIEQAVIAIEEEGNSNIIIHHCPSGYPARLESINLKMINAQLGNMITKLEQKLQKEVQQRIENQKKLKSHIESIGSQVENNLITQFDSELEEMNDSLDIFESNIKDWQPEVLRQLTDNRSKINHFN